MNMNWILAIFSLATNIVFPETNIYLSYWFYVLFSYWQTSISIFTCGIFSLFFLGFDCLSDKSYGHTLVLVLIFAQPSMTSAVHTHTHNLQTWKEFQSFLLYPFPCCWTFFHVLAIVNSAAMNIGVHVCFWIMVFSGYMPRSEIPGSHGKQK